MWVRERGTNNNQFNLGNEFSQSSDGLGGGFSFETSVAAYFETKSAEFASTAGSILNVGSLIWVVGGLF